MLNKSVLNIHIILIRKYYDLATIVDSLRQLYFANRHWYN